MLRIPLECIGRLKLSKDAVVFAPVVGPDGIFCGNRDEVLHKIARRSLKPAWGIPAEGFSPFFAFNKLAILNNLRDGTLRAVSSDTGADVWFCKPGGRQGFLRETTLVEVGSGVRTLDLCTGRMTEPLELPGHFQLQPMALCQDALIAEVTDQSSILAINIRSLGIVWERGLLREFQDRLGLDRDNCALAVTCGGKQWFIATLPGGLFGVSLDEGNVLWHTPISVPYYWPNVHEGRIYVLTSYPARFVCLDQETGGIIYDRPQQEAALYKITKGTIDDGYIAYGVGRLLLVFRLEDGELVWKYEHDDNVYMPVIADDRIFVTTGNGTLLVFE
jgi:outer membrane protein assembly factor BamB